MAGSDFSGALRGIADILMYKQQVQNEQLAAFRDMEIWKQKQEFLAKLEEEREKRKVVTRDVVQDQEGRWFEVRYNTYGEEIGRVDLPPNKVKEREAELAAAEAAARDKKADADRSEFRAQPEYLNAEKENLLTRTESARATAARAAQGAELDLIQAGESTTRFEEERERKENEELAEIDTILGEIPTELKQDEAIANDIARLEDERSEYDPTAPYDKRQEVLRRIRPLANRLKGMSRQRNRELTRKASPFGPLLDTTDPEAIRTLLNNGD